MTMKSREFQKLPSKSEVAALKARALAAEAKLAELNLRHHGLDVDRLARVVRLNGQRRELSQVQFDLLVYLLLHRGRILPAEELLPVFAKSASRDKNMVAFHIFHLRRALWPTLIRTFKGQGYTIDPESETTDAA